MKPMTKRNWIVEYPEVNSLHMNVTYIHTNKVMSYLFCLIWGNYLWSVCWYVIVCPDSLAVIFLPFCFLSKPKDVLLKYSHILSHINTCILSFKRMWVIMMRYFENWLDKVSNKICSIRWLWVFKCLSFVNCHLTKVCVSVCVW